MRKNTYNTLSRLGEFVFFACLVRCGVLKSVERSLILLHACFTHAVSSFQRKLPILVGQIDASPRG